MFDLIGLGALAGVLPVYLGIVAAMLIARTLSRAWEGFLVGLATGILAYLFFDLMHEAVELSGARDPASWAVFLGSLLISFVGLVFLEQNQMQRTRPFGHVLSLPYVIASGMGLHNLGEGLAIGVSYAGGQWALSTLLVVGFALHNGTEGFGIVGSAGMKSINAKEALFLGLIAGVPTCLGTILSGQDLSPYFSLACYTLAAGSLLYVIIALTAISYTASRRIQVGLGVFFGVTLMYLTGMLLTLLGVGS
ncbi:MAG: zinc transporter ZupT [Nitrospiraceae bacterium]